MLALVPPAGWVHDRGTKGAGMYIGIGLGTLILIIVLIALLT